MKRPLLISCLVLVSLAAHGPVSAATLFQDGFESGDDSHVENGAGWLQSGNWNAGGTVAVTSDLPRTGLYSMKFHFPGNSDLFAGQSAEQRFTLGAGRADVYIRYYIRFPVNYAHAYPSSANRSSFINFSTGKSHSFGGKYVEMKPNELLRYTDTFDDPALPGEMMTTVSLKPVSCGTELRITQEGIPAAIPVEMCYLGWQKSLEKLARLVEPDIPDA